MNMLEGNIQCHELIKKPRHVYATIIFRYNNAVLIFRISIAKFHEKHVGRRHGQLYVIQTPVTRHIDGTLQMKVHPKAPQGCFLDIHNAVDVPFLDA